MDARDRSSLESRRREDWRQLEHLAPLGFAFLLPYLPYWAVVGLACLALVHALVVSPRLIRVTTREDEARRGFSPGKIYYALAVLVLVLVFKERLYIAACVWAILAAGDSFSNLIGRRLGGPALPYNGRKTFAGSFSFWFFGALAGWVLAVWNAPGERPWERPGLALFAATAALLCALAESLPAVIDDNLAVSWVGALTLWTLFSISSPEARPAAPWLHALAANLGAAAMARGFGWLSWRGTALAVAFGLVVYKALGPVGFFTMGLFLVLASLATQLGFQHKAGLKIAQADQGRRGVSNILSNGFVALGLATVSFWLHEPVIRVAYCAAIATAAFDTVATEIGQWLGRRPYSPVLLRAVAVGTPGAVSLEGTVAGMLAGLAVALFPALTGWLPWYATPIIWLGALSGSLLESVLASLHNYDFPFSDEALNLHSTLFGAFTGGLLWNLLA